MFENIRFKKYKKELATLYNTQSKLQSEYEDKMDEYRCSLCEKYISKAVRNYQDKFVNCKGCDVCSNMQSLAADLDKLSQEIDLYIQNIYAKAVFDHYRKRKPSLVQNGKVHFEWGSIFGEAFDKLSIEKKNALVGLVENYGEYRFS